MFWYWPLSQSTVIAIEIVIEFGIPSSRYSVERVNAVEFEIKGWGKDLRSEFQRDLPRVSFAKTGLQRPRTRSCCWLKWPIFPRNNPIRRRLRCWTCKARRCRPNWSRGSSTDHPGLCIWEFRYGWISSRICLYVSFEKAQIPTGFQIFSLIQSYLVSNPFDRDVSSSLRKCLWSDMVCAVLVISLIFTSNVEMSWCKDLCFSSNLTKKKNNSF